MKEQPGVCANFPDFSDTEIAFRRLSRSQLRLMHVLFRAMGNSTLSYAMPKMVTWGLKLKLPMTKIVELTVFRQFCGGSSIEGSQELVDSLAAHNIKTVLDYGVEHQEDEEALEAVAQEIARTIEFGKQNPNVTFAVFKPTGIVRMALMEKAVTKAELTDEETAELDRAKRRFEGLCEKAHENDLPILVDAEETWIQDIIDDWTLGMMRKCNREKVIVYNTLQMYRWDRLDYLKELHQIAGTEKFHVGIKIVRGAYMEKERARALDKGYADPIHVSKDYTDRDYNQAQTYCIKNINRIALWSGTHNEESTRQLALLVDRHKISRDNPRVYSSQLLGMSDNLSFNLAHHGYNVVKYVPYGPVKLVLPYLMRRAEENSSIKGQASRELQLIVAEVRRRKMAALIK